MWMNLLGRLKNYADQVSLDVINEHRGNWCLTVTPRPATERLNCISWSLSILNRWSSRNESLLTEQKGKADERQGQKTWWYGMKWRSCQTYPWNNPSLLVSTFFSIPAIVFVFFIIIRLFECSYWRLNRLNSLRYWPWWVVDFTTSPRTQVSRTCHPALSITTAGSNLENLVAAGISVRDGQTLRNKHDNKAIETSSSSLLLTPSLPHCHSPFLVWLRISRPSHTTSLLASVFPARPPARRALTLRAARVSRYPAHCSAPVNRRP